MQDETKILTNQKPSSEENNNNNTKH